VSRVDTNNADYLRMLRHKAKEQGLCSICRARAATEGKLSCEDCRDRVAAVKERLTKKGRCRCGKKRRRGRADCIHCARAAARASALRIAIAKAVGLCMRCQREPAVAGLVHCEPCRQDNALRQRVRNAAIRASIRESR
jgi:hypothetical protein